MPNTQIEHKAVYGLELQSNSFKVREGSLEVASNIVVVQDDIYKLRRGFKEFVDTVPVVQLATTEYQDKIVGVATDRVQVFNQVESGDNVGDYLSTTDLNNDTGVTVQAGAGGQKPRFVESNGNMYFTSDNGVMKLESSASNVLQAGVQRALDLEIFRVFKPAGGPETYFPTNSQIGYRIVFMRKDANQNTVIGAPSEFAVVANGGTSGAYTVTANTPVTGTHTITLTVGASHGFSTNEFISISGATGNIPEGTYQITGTGATTVTFLVTITPAPSNGTLQWGTFKYCKLQFTLPDQIQTTEYIYRIYRAAASALSAIPPDESTLQLIDEVNVSSDDLSVGFVTYYDITPDLLKGAYLYTNPNTGEPRGEAEANDPPPQCTDMVLFKNHVFYANCQLPYDLPISLISASSGSMPDGAQFTIAQEASERTFGPSDVNTGTDTITCANHGLASGDPIRFVTSGTLPSGITEAGLWYAISVTSSTFRVASSYANAIANTPVDITTTGSGTFSVFKVRAFIGHATTDIGNRSVQPTSFSVLGTTVTVNYAAGHGFATGDQIAVVEAVDSNEDQLANFPRGLYTITVASGTQFTFTVPGTPSTPAALTIQGVKDVSQNRMFYISQSSSALGTVASSIDTTARAIIKAVNQDPSKYCVAFYLSGSNDVPGKMDFQSTDFSSTFTVSAVTAAIEDSFIPRISQTDSEAVGTRNDEQGVLYIGKPNEPEAVPRANKIIVGSRSDKILRIKALRDSLIVLKKEGAFRINGTDINSFQPTILDSTVSCRSTDSVAVLNNQVFCLSTQGVVAISENAAAIVSRSIEPLLTAILGKRSTVDGSDLVEMETHAGSYESERLYMLSTMSPQSQVTDIVYVYNQLTNAWTTSTKIFKDFFINPAEDRAYLIDTDDILQQERKRNNRLDYTEEQFDATILSTPTDDSVTMSVVGGTANVGDIFVKSGTEVINRIVSVETVAGNIVYTFANAHDLDPADVGLIYKAIEANIRTSPLHGGQVSRWKQFSEFQATFRNQASMSRMTVSFVTDSVYGTEDTEWQSSSVNLGWGYEPWGNFPWGLADGINVQFDTTPVQILRTYIPLEAQRATYIQVNLRHAVAAENLMMQAIAYTARAYGQRTTR